jgi:hypothetical protein
MRIGQTKLSLDDADSNWDIKYMYKTLVCEYFASAKWPDLSIVQNSSWSTAMSSILPLPLSEHFFTLELSLPHDLGKIKVIVV